MNEISLYHLHNKVKMVIVKLLQEALCSAPQNIIWWVKVYCRLIRWNNLEQMNGVVHWNINFHYAKILHTEIYKYPQIIMTCYSLVYLWLIDWTYAYWLKVHSVDIGFIILPGHLLSQCFYVIIQIGHFLR